MMSETLLREPKPVRGASMPPKAAPPTAGKQGLPPPRQPQTAPAPGRMPSARTDDRAPLMRTGGRDVEAGSNGATNTPRRSKDVVSVRMTNTTCVVIVFLVGLLLSDVRGHSSR